MRPQQNVQGQEFERQKNERVQEESQSVGYGDV